jgi:hypothetical protein
LNILANFRIKSKLLEILFLWPNWPWFMQKKPTLKISCLGTFKVGRHFCWYVISPWVSFTVSLWSTLPDIFSPQSLHVLFIPMPPVIGQPLILCHPRWLPTQKITEFAVGLAGAGFEPRTAAFHFTRMKRKFLSQVVCRLRRKEMTQQNWTELQTANYCKGHLILRRVTSTWNVSSISI